MFSVSSADSDLVEFCLNAPPDRLVGRKDLGKKVVRISEDLVIKHGRFVTKEEALNQQRAFELVDRNIVCIPQVYRFFSDETGRGYIMMEFVEGKIIDPLDDQRLIDKLVRILDHFSTITSDVPGPLSRGPCAGLLWPDAEEPSTFESKQEMETWFNNRLFPGEGSMTFEHSDLVLCHLDIAPRNIIWKPDGEICLLDWESAGFYPRLFEFWPLWNLGEKEGVFNGMLLNSMRPLPEYESNQKWPICRVWYNTQKYSPSSL